MNISKDEELYDDSFSSVVSSNDEKPDIQPYGVIIVVPFLYSLQLPNIIFSCFLARNEITL